MSGNGLPPRLRTVFIAITEWPTTNSIKLSALVLINATGVLLALASARSADVSEGVLAVWLGALLAMMGVAQWATKIKRENPMPSPPVDAEDVASTQGTPTVKPVLTQEVAQQAADAYAGKPPIPPTAEGE